MEDNFDGYDEIKEVDEIKKKLESSIEESIGETFKVIGAKVKDEEAGNIIGLGFLITGVVALIGIGAKTICDLSKNFLKK